jgi:integrase
MAAARQFGTIRKLPSGRFQARYSHLGRQVSAKTTFPTKTGARQWLSSAETDLQRGEHFDESFGSIRFEDYAFRWLDERPLRHNTRQLYDSQLRKWIIGPFGSVRLNDIMTPDVRSWRADLLKTHLSENTVAKLYRLFRTIMETAVEDGLIRTNPVKMTGAAKENVHKRPEVTFPEVVRLAEVIEPEFAALVWVGATSGLRYGELTALRREDVDLEGGKLHVRWSLSFQKGVGPTFGPPKTMAGIRVVALDSETLEILSGHMDTFTEPEPDALVFRSIKKKPLLNRYFQPSWRRARRDAGVAENLRFHDLRHLAGTTAASSGASTVEVMARLGHSTPDTSLRYTRATEARDAEIAASIGDRIRRDLS